MLYNGHSLYRNDHWKHLTIALEDGREVFIHSYGEPSYIVARIGEDTYHLGCEVIGKILLDEIK